jgi:hypothetical protein
LLESNLEIISQRSRLETFSNTIQDLERLLPICAECKKIKSDSGQWIPLETVIKQKTGITFTHGLCPFCLQKHQNELEK